MSTLCVVMIFSCVLSLGEWKDRDMRGPLGATVGTVNKFWTTWLSEAGWGSRAAREGLQNVQPGK